MTTAGDIRDRIKLDLVINGSAYDAQILAAIQSALRQLRGKRYWFLETVATLTLVPTANSLTLPDTWGAPQSFSLLYGGQNLSDGQGFDFLTYDRLRYTYWTTNPLPTTVPRACAIVNQTLYFSCLSNSTYSINATYYAQDATLPDAGDTSIWFDEGYDVVRSLAQFIFKRNAQGFTATDEDGEMAALQLQSLGTTHENRYEGR